VCQVHGEQSRAELGARKAAKERGGGVTAEPTARRPATQTRSGVRLCVCVCVPSRGSLATRRCSAEVLAQTILFDLAETFDWWFNVAFWPVKVRKRNATTGTVYLTAYNRVVRRTLAEPGWYAVQLNSNILFVFEQ